jgi:hypothetical protein
MAPNMVQFCKDALSAISPKWERALVRDFAKYIRREFDSGPSRFGNTDADKLFLFRLIADCYIRLDESK